MNITKITAVYYSATGNTKKIVSNVTKQLAHIIGIPYSFLSFTLPGERDEVHTFASDELVIFAVPVYAGRIPNKLLPYVQTGFIGQNTPIFPIAVYGNRNFDHALSELCGELTSHGFIPFAATAMASRHAFSDAIGSGRPDAQDFKQLSNFTDAVGNHLIHTAVLSPVSVPGSWPDAPYYKPLGKDGEPANFLKAKPRTKEELCDHCGACAKICPMGAIDLANPILVPGTCIKCQGCIRICPIHAKYFDDPAFLSHVEMLKTNFTGRAENCFFLPNESTIR